MRRPSAEASNGPKRERSSAAARMSRQRRHRSPSAPTRVWTVGEPFALARGGPDEGVPTRARPPHVPSLRQHRDRCGGPLVPLFISLLRLLRLMDKPFHVAERTKDDVSLFLLRRFVERLDRTRTCGCARWGTRVTRQRRPHVPDRGRPRLYRVHERAGDEAAAELVSRFAEVAKACIEPARTSEISASPLRTLAPGGHNVAEGGRR